MDKDDLKGESTTNISKKGIKLGWFFKFLLISGTVFLMLLFIWFILLDISDRNSIGLQNEINESEYKSDEGSDKGYELQTPVIVQDTDPVIDCISEDCGTRRIKQSACSLSVCCEVGDDWVWTNSEMECRNAQDAEYEHERSLEREKNEAEYLMGQTELYYDCLEGARKSRDACREDCSKTYEGDVIGTMGCEVEICDPSYLDYLDFCE